MNPIQGWGFFLPNLWHDISQPTERRDNQLDSIQVNENHE